MNYLKLTDLKSPEAYKERAAETRRQRKEAETLQRQEDAQRRKAMTPEEREAESAAKDAIKAQKESLADEQRIQAQEFIAQVAKLAGWDEKEVSFENRATRLKVSGASDERIEQMEQRHFDRLLKRAEAVVKQTKRQILLDHEMRAEAGLGAVPLTTQDDSLISLADLDPDRAEKGLGYQQERTRKSDREIVADLAAADVEDLRGDLIEAAGLVDDDRPHTVAREERLRQELRVAELCRQAAETPREELEQREQQLRAAIESELAQVPTRALLRAVDRMHEEDPTFQTLSDTDKPSDLAVMQRINADRREKLESAREVLGRTLGELEAIAALNVALKQRKPKELHVALGPVGNEAAIRQVRSIGLGRNDYILDTDGVNRFVTIKPEAFDKLVTKIDPAEQQVRDEIAAIKAGASSRSSPPSCPTWPATSKAICKSRSGCSPTSRCRAKARSPGPRWISPSSSAPSRRSSPGSGWGRSSARITRSAWPRTATPTPTW